MDSGTVRGLITAALFVAFIALVFWAFLETRSVFVTGMIGGIYLVLGAGLAPWFGSLVDHHRKRPIMLASSAVSGGLYAAALGVYWLTPPEAMTGTESWISAARNVVRPRSARYQME